jgi:RNA polymerase sigma factor (sigma-70 family)
LYDVKLPKTLDKQLQEELLKKYIETKDKDIRDTLILHNLKLVKYISKRYQVQNNPLREDEDLFGEGVLGLINGIESYDPEKGSFSNHAAIHIRAKVGSYIRDKTRGLRIPAHVYEDLHKIRTFKRDYLNVNGYYPSTEDISQGLNMDQARVEEYLSINQSTASLDKSISEDGEDITLGDTLEDVESKFEDRVLSSVFVEEFMLDMKQYLETEEHEMIRLSLGLDCREHQLKEVARILDYSIKDAQKVKNQAFRKVRGSQYVRDLYNERRENRKKLHTVVKGSSDQFPYTARKFTIY